MVTIPLFFKIFNSAKAVFRLGWDKAPDPYGFPMIFFQKFWNVIKEDVLAFMREFHSKCKLSKGIGASFIALLPKRRS